MARGRKPKLTIAEQIEAKKQEIEGIEEELKTAKAELKELEAIADKAKMEDLMVAIQNSGKSYEEVMDFLG